MAKSPYRPFTPKSEQSALVPYVSGNTINGLGESAHRQPRYVCWHDPDSLPHGQMQKWFYTQNMDHPGILAARAAREKIHEAPMPEVNDEPLQQSAEEWTEQLSKHAQTLDFELFGITRFNPDWCFEGVQIDRKWIIMVGVAHDYEQITKAPNNSKR